MKEAIKKWIRPLALPGLHAWQWFHDYSLRVLRDFRDRRRALSADTIVTKDVYGIRFVLYPCDRPNVPYLYRRSHDAGEFQAIPRLLRPGDVALDVGANIGMYSVLLSRLCGPSGRVWAFEPVPDTYWKLRETLALNRCENVLPMQAAVCDKPGSVRMTLFEPQFAEWNTLATPSAREHYGKPVSPSRSIEVPALALDSFCEAEGIQRINLLKVDVEGFEIAVFQGAERLLRENRVDCICFEIAQAPLQEAGFKSSQVFAALEAFGYKAYRFNAGSSSFQGPVRDTTEAWTNFFASRQDLTSLGGAASAHELVESKQ